MANKIMRIRGNRQGRGEGRQEKHSFSKMQTAKRRRRAAGNYFYKIAEKIKKIQKNAAVRKGRQHPLITGSRSQHLLPYSQTGRRFSPPEP